MLLQLDPLLVQRVYRPPNLHRLLPQGLPSCSIEVRQCPPTIVIRSQEYAPTFSSHSLLCRTSYATHRASFYTFVTISSFWSQWVQTVHLWSSSYPRGAPLSAQVYQQVDLSTPQQRLVRQLQLLCCLWCWLFSDLLDWPWAFLMMVVLHQGLPWRSYILTSVIHR